MAHFFEGIVTVWELVKSGGWMMLPIILSSVAALGIIVERLWTLRASRVTPEHLLGQVWVWIKDKQMDKEKLKQLRADSPLGEILAAGLANSRHGREIMKECIEEAAARVIHELERRTEGTGKRFFFPRTTPVCPNMARVTAGRVLACLRDGTGEVGLPDESVIARSTAALDRMLEMAR